MLDASDVTSESQITAKNKITALIMLGLTVAWCRIAWIILLNDPVVLALIFTMCFHVHLHSSFS